MIIFFLVINKGISDTFDAISKVYSCRVDDILMAGNKLVKEFVSETKNQNIVKENETKTKQKYRVCIKYFSLKKLVVLLI